MLTSSTEDKVKIVQRNVNEVYTLIDEIKQQELLEARRKALYERNLMLQRQQQQSFTFGSVQNQTDGSRERGGGGRGRGGGLGKGGGPRRSSGSAKKKSVLPESANRAERDQIEGSLSLFFFVLIRSSGVQIAANSPPSTSQAKNVESANDDQSSASVSSQEKCSASSSSSCSRIERIDYTKIPSLIENVFHRYDSSGSVRPTIISIGKVWKKETRESIIAPFVTKFLENDEQLKAKNEAFLLLDCLTKSGSICVQHCQLHIVVSSTHCYNKTLMNSVIQQNINPIEEVERSHVILASIIHQETGWNLIHESERERISQRYSTGRYDPTVLPAAQDTNSMKLLPTGEYFQRVREEI